MGKKKVAKKTATRKKKTVKSQATASTKSSTNSGQKDSLFGNERFCITGRFSYSPSKELLEKFIRANGGQLTEKVDKELDVLVVGEGKKTKKEKDAEQLNLNGAGIRIVDQVEDLTDGLESKIAAMLFEPDQFIQLAELSNYPWLFRAKKLEIRNEVFQGKQIGKKLSKQRKSVCDINISDCGFSDCLFEEVDLNGHYRSSAVVNCQFDRCQFNDLKIMVEDATFQKCKGEKLDLGSATRVQMNDCDLDYLAVGNNANANPTASISNCTIGVFKPSGMWDQTMNQLSLSNVTLRDLRLFGSARFNKANFEKVKISYQDKQVGLHFDRCKLVDVTFDKLELQELKFTECELINCRFDSCDVTMLGFGEDTTLSGCSSKKSNFKFVQFNETQARELSGQDLSSKLLDLSLFSKTQELAKAIKSSTKLNFDFEASFGEDDLVTLSLDSSYRLEFSYSAKKDRTHVGEDKQLDRRSPVDVIAKKMIWLFSVADFHDVIAGSIKTRTSGCKLKPKELKSLILAAACEVIGKEPMSEQELKKAEKESKAKTKEIRAEIVDELKNSQISKFNKRTLAELKSCSPFRKLDLSNTKLGQAKFADLVFEDCNFSNADLSGAKFEGANFRKSNFSKANLSGIQFKNTKLRGANLTGANLSKVKIANSDFTDAILKNADFSGALFQTYGTKYYKLGVDLRGVDLSSAKLKGANLDSARYDEKTVLPKSITKTQLKRMAWEGGGVPPHERKQNKKIDGPIDFDKFMERIKEITDASRLDKSMKMLKADSFQLFSDVKDDVVLGVVKSQSEAGLVYSCKLDKSGNFACCSQNLNPCGGLRGAVCKHILVLILGLTQVGKLDAGEVDGWINESKMKSPELDKDEMSEVLLKYKGAEAGEIDWRPTETVPEDFFAF